MGGLGSGGYNSKGRRTVESQYRLDATHFKRRGLIEPGRVTTLSWSKGERESGPSLRVIGGGESVTLEYAWRRGDGPWQPHTERIGLASVPRQFGGEEVYFLCPKCAGRVKRLYGAGVRYLCRHCHNLVHASTQERPGNRASRRNRKLRRKLGVEIGLGDWIGPKPKGMHWKTFETISARIHDAEAEVYDDMLVLLNRMKLTTERRSDRIRRIGGAKDFWR